MHIAFLTSEYPHPQISKSAGIGTSIKNLAKELVVQNQTVSVFVYGQDRTEKFNDGNISVYKIKHKKYKLFGWYCYRKYIQKYINKTVKSNGIDLIEAADWTGITAFMKFKCPLVIRLHGTDGYFCHLENRPQKRKNYFFEKLALKNANKIVSVSAFTAKKTLAIFKLNRDIQVVHNGIDTDKFAPTNNTPTPNSILYFGSIIRKKGVLELAYIFNEVVQKVPNAQLTLLGKDVKDILTGTSTLELFKNKLSEKAIASVNHVSNVPYEEVHSYLAKTQIVVLPSFAEAFPMTWLEAMSMKKALVTSNIGWATELMVDGETGYMVHPQQHKEYANKMVSLLNDQELREQFGENARRHIVDNFEQQKIAQSNIEYYKSVV
jgi:glycosyltransferase involved in cell wall biosynthesis